MGHDIFSPHLAKFHHKLREYSEKYICNDSLVDNYRFLFTRDNLQCMETYTPSNG